MTFRAHVDPQEMMLPVLKTFHLSPIHTPRNQDLHIFRVYVIYVFILF